MFTEARIKLTIWYSLIIMIISVFFSLIIYHGSTAELNRIEMFERHNSQILDEIRDRIGIRLFYLNLIILGLSGTAGYFLAGKTLDPIGKMVLEQKEFISNASHELRTPLTSIKTEIEVGLRDKNLNLISAKELLKSNLEDVNTMTKLSNYLLKLSRLEFQNEMPMTKVDLKDIAISAIGKLYVKTDLEKSVVIGNADSLKELVSILVDNAIKYGKGKSVEVKVFDHTIIVKDHGIGISESDLPHIFDRFYRGGMTRGKDGYGLGLSIAKSIVEIHKGKIEVTSKVDDGTTFKVILS